MTGTVALEDGGQIKPMLARMSSLGVSAAKAAGEATAAALANRLDTGRLPSGDPAPTPIPDTIRRGTVKWGYRTGTLRSSLRAEMDGRTSKVVALCTHAQFGTVFRTGASAKKLALMPEVVAAVRAVTEAWLKNETGKLTNG